MKLGIVGLPNVGKSTLFNAITQAGAEVANYPFCTIEPNVGVVNVPDHRLQHLVNLYDSKKVIPATIEFVDIAGLVEGASKGEGLGNRFLANIREVDAILHVVRCFEDTNIIHVDGKTEPKHDIEIIDTELLLSDIEFLERQKSKLEKVAKSGDKVAKATLEEIKKLLEHMNKGQSVRSYENQDVSFSEFLKTFPLLTAKPVLFIANVSEDALEKSDNHPLVAQVKEAAKKEQASYVIVSAAIEAEIAALAPEDRAEFLSDLGLTESGLDQIIKASYSLLGLISYLTAGPQEVRAWTITKGTKAPQAAGKIHSDFERGFIRAEVIAFNDLIREGTMAKAKEKGLVRSEGKEYIVNDGDIMLFRFNV